MSESNENETHEEYQEDVVETLKNTNEQLEKHFQEIYLYAAEKSFVSLGNFPKTVEAYKTILEDNFEEIQSIEVGDDCIPIYIMEALDIFDPVYTKLIRIAEMIEDEYLHKKMKTIFLVLGDGKSIDFKFIHLFNEYAHQYYKGFHQLFVEKGIV
jgi:hypothetical protein